MVSQINLNGLRSTRLADSGTITASDMSYQLIALETDSTSKLLHKITILFSLSVI
jgi:hypothetical protein